MDHTRVAGSLGIVTCIDYMLEMAHRIQSSHNASDCEGSGQTQARPDQGHDWGQGQQLYGRVL